LLAPAGGPIRLGVNGNHLMMAVQQGLQMVGGEIGSARENDAQAGALGG
jgi:hypothetical protein